MNSEPQIINFPKNISDIINETYNIYNSIDDDNKTYSNCLIIVLKKYHLWPNIKVKKFKNRSDIVLLHNNYKMGCIYEYKELYEQCRSIVLDFTQSFNNNVVVTFANSIPERSDITNYMSKLYSNTDKCYEAYDGTMITIYNHYDNWYFGTSSCPDANSSKFSHPTKTHGNMFDEILYKYFGKLLNQDELSLSHSEVSKLLRNKFTSYLDKSKSYEFIIIHHENVHIIDYTNVFGEKYMEIVHVNTKNRNSMTEEYISNVKINEFVELGVTYPLEFSDISSALNHINTN